MLYNTQLETFVKVADAGSFNKAAAESYISSTAVIKQINLLEKSLGVKLFDRNHRGLQLTAAGKSFYQDAKYIIDYCHASVLRVKRAERENENVIRIGSSPMPKVQEADPTIVENQVLSGKDGAGSNVSWNGFQNWAQLDEDIIVVSAQFTDWHETSARQAIELTEYFMHQGILQVVKQCRRQFL